MKELLKNIQKPSRYIGGEYGSIIKEDKQKRFAFCFPDTYEIGMSNLAMQILYSLINSTDTFSCERVFAPDIDFENKLRETNTPLFSIETKTPLKDFDILGFSLGYELCYTNILNILELSKIPLLSKDRDDSFPLIIAGGCCTCNPAPLTDFFDLFVVGEGEEVTLELLDLYNKCKSKTEFKEKALDIEGVYIPHKNIAKRRIVKDLDIMFSPKNFVMPYCDIVHERASVEVLRGCIRGCRFCQAGFIYRPYREKSADTIIKQAETLCKNTGYEELSLISLSTSDHTEINKTMCELINFTAKERVSLALPSMRIDSFSSELAEYLTKVRKTGLTFAPEAGTQRLRNVINKNLTEDEILSACETAFNSGYTTVKLYFMLGLPTETDEDILGIADLAQKIERLYYSLGNTVVEGEYTKRIKKTPCQINISVSTFVPKPWTPFQYEGQASEEDIRHKQEILRNAVKSKHMKLSLSEPYSSILEAVLARGDEFTGAVILKAFQSGCKFDAWKEHFHWDKWLQAFEDCGIDHKTYAQKKYSYNDILPWEKSVDMGFTKDFLAREHSKAMTADVTENCRKQCAGCGIENCKARDLQPSLTNYPISIVDYSYPKDMYFPKIRVIFEKTGELKFISHLDLSDTMQHIIKRSGLPVKYTEGFNPHYGVSFPMALPFGVESLCEVMDFKLEKELSFEEIKTKLNNAMPKGLKAISVSSPILDIKDIAFAEYEINGAENLSEFLKQDTIIIGKKSKQKHRKIIKEIDIRPNIELLSENTIRLPLSVLGGLNPVAVLEAYNKFFNINGDYRILKTKLLTAEYKDFR